MKKQAEDISRRNPQVADKSICPIMSSHDFARLGGGEVAYIRAMSSVQARKVFRGIKGLQRKGKIFSLHAADGELLAISDTREGALGQAIEDNLKIALLQ